MITLPSTPMRLRLLDPGAERAAGARRAPRSTRRSRRRGRARRRSTAPRRRVGAASRGRRRCAGRLRRLLERGRARRFLPGFAGASAAARPRPSAARAGRGAEGSTSAAGSGERPARDAVAALPAVCGDPFAEALLEPFDAIERGPGPDRRVSRRASRTSATSSTSRGSGASAPRMSTMAWPSVSRPRDEDRRCRARRRALEPLGSSARAVDADLAAARPRARRRRAASEEVFGERRGVDARARASVADRDSAPATSSARDGLEHRDRGVEGCRRSTRVDLGRRSTSAGAEREGLVEQRQRVAGGARARRGDGVERLGLELDALALEQSTRADRVSSSIERRVNSKCWVRERMVGSTFCGSVVGEDEDDVRGRLLERLQQRVRGRVLSMCTSSIMYTLPSTSRRSRG